MLLRTISTVLTALSVVAAVFAQTTVLNLTATNRFGVTQTWTNNYCEPVTVRITAQGSGGGSGYFASSSGFSSTYPGSTGATMAGTFVVQPGHTLRAIAGGPGDNATTASSLGLTLNGGGGGAGSGVSNQTTSSLMLLAAGGSGAHSGGGGIGGSASTSGSGNGGGSGTWSTGGGGLNSAGIASGSNGCPSTGGAKVSLTSISAGSNRCSTYSGAGSGGYGMGGGGGASNYRGGGGGHTGGDGGNSNGDAPAQSFNAGTSQVNTNGVSGTTANFGWVKIELLSAVPTIACKNAAVTLPQSGTVTIDPNQIFNGPGQFCSAMTASPATLNCSNLGSNTVTLSMGGNGNPVVSCTATVTVTDVLAPSITCNSVQASLNASGNASVATSALATATDNCSVQLSSAPANYTCANLGTNTITVTATDNSGNTATCVATVTVVDQINPTVTCKNTTVTLNAGGTATITKESVFESSSDNCGQVTLVSVNPPVVNCSQLGTTTIVLYAIDGSLNSANCTATVTVVDNTPPSATCKNATVSLGANGSAVLVPSAFFMSGTDNCGTVTPQSVSPATVSCSNIGTSAITLSVTDGNGNQSTCSAEVTVVDEIAPTIQCQNVTVYLNSNGSVSVNSAAIFVSGSDNCGTVNPINDPNETYTCNDLGPNTVFLSVTDGHGNYAGCSAVIVVQENIAPTVVCQNTTVNLDASGAGSITTASVFQSGSDNCGIVNQVSALPNTFTCSNLGTNTVTLTVNDGHGNTATCSATVTVVDAIAPTVICKSATVNLNTAGVGSITIASVFQSGSDNCGIVNQVSALPNTFTCSNLGANTVTLTVNDGHGNTATCSATVTVVDAIAPTVVCKNATVNLNASGAGSITTASVFQSGSDNCGIVNQVSALPNTFTCSNLGANTVTLTVNDGHGNTGTCSATVTVVDAIAPTVVCKNATVNLDAAGTGSITTASVFQNGSDNCGVVNQVSALPNTFSCSNLGANTVTLTVNDGHGNTGTCSATVTVVDAIAPTVICKNATVNLNAAGAGSITTASVFQSGTDNCGVVNQVSALPNTFTCSNLGANTVTLTVNDGHGNTATCSATVTVVDAIAPTVVCKNTTVNLDASGAGSITTASVFQSGSDNCGTVNQVSALPNAFTCSNLGANTVTLTVNDGHGNTGTCSATVTVVDAIAPTVVCKNASISLNAAGSASITPNTIFQSGSDNCGIVNLVSVEPATFNCSTLGQNAVYLNVNDGHGNTANCYSIVTVSDVTPPTAICQNVSINLDASGSASVTAAQVNNGSFDNCTIAALSLNTTNFSCANIGANTVVLTAKDQSGNIGTCSAVVTVRDLITPSAKCKNATVSLGSNGSVTVPGASVNNGSSDNCSFTLSLSPATFTCSNVGANSVTLRVTDAGGNTATCAATVTVQDAAAPSALCKNPTIYLDATGQATLTTAQVNNGSYDNCGIASMTLSKTQFYCSDLNTVYPVVVLTVKDNYNNTSTCTAQVIVKDNIAPTAICENTTAELGFNGKVTVYGQALASESFDNCSVWSYSPVAKVYTTANIGNNNLLITVKDWSGNVATCTSVVTVVPYSGFTGNGTEDRNVENEFAGNPSAMAVYPNPTSGTVYMAFELPSDQPFTVQLTDMRGRLVLSRKYTGQEGENTIQFETESTPSGIYNVQLIAEGINTQKRLIIQQL